ncbi:MAG TPA: DUF1538 domain-containing protein [Candidatus Mediterraneibacter quadrami]|uniref:DUF1538 domain-containing protein n=1 Tax=Candidatus Mediterraneibacter quadrami TaxID=2838684 RepID=A0A9D2RD21_9FIRM|nr:DUF1538 domain-containing protein [Candidatus Mediterraneibacter quadrami]
MNLRKTKLKEKLLEKLEETLKAVLPVLAIVLVLCFTVAPVEPGIMLAFLLGAVLLIVGMMFFTLGADMAMTPIGENVGTGMTKTRKLWLMVALTFILGFIVTMAEPDLQVLAEQVPSVPNIVLVLSVAAGVGIFLVSALLRMLYRVSLSHMLIVLYAAVFLLAYLAPGDYIAVAFDAGGVTTGPMTVPFIMAFGIGISAIRSDERAEDDSFGLVALSSVGPILSVLALSLIYRPESAEYVPARIPDIGDSVELWKLFAGELPEYMKEMAISLLPIIFFFSVFQFVFRQVPKRMLIRTGVGMIYTYVGLVLFLTGVNVGFMPAGNYMGQVLAGQPYKWLIVPAGMLIGFFIVRAEPAVFVLTRQVEDITSGAISAGAMGLSLSIGVAVSLGLAMVRVLTGISVFWFVIPGYAAALLLSFFVPKIFTAIAFDSGGVASGPMTATFLLPFAIGVCTNIGGNVVTDAFGVVAMVAMTPLITIQTLGLVYELRSGYLERRDAKRAEAVFEQLPDDEIIEL